MKSKKVSGRLVLNKRTIADLKHQDMGKIYAGIDEFSLVVSCLSIKDPVCPVTCLASCPCPPTQ